MKFFYSKKHDDFLYLKEMNNGLIDATIPGGVDNALKFMKGVDKIPIYLGEPMEFLIPNTVDSSLEKHLPVVEINGDTIKVKVGEECHPMTDEHHIRFIILETTKHRYEEWWPWMKEKLIDNKPEVKFHIDSNDKPLRVYAFCNLHGLWVREL